MATRGQTDLARPGDTLLAIHDFSARSSDELSLARGDRIELIERDDEFGDGWFLGKHLSNGETGLFPEVYTTMAPKPTITAAMKRSLAQATTGASQVSEPTPAQQKTMSLPAGAVSQFERFSQGSTLTGESAEQPSTTAAYTPSYSADTKTPPITPTTPAGTTTARRIMSAPSARSLSLGSPIHENSPVMNETLSVIEEHITDMNTPRSSLLVVDERGEDDIGGFATGAQNRLSYINGHETDEEESSSYTEAEVMSWTPDQVARFLEQRGVDQSQCQVFRDEEITGEVLLHMEQSSLMLKQFDLGKMGRRLALWHKIQEFQTEVRGQKRSSRNNRSYSTAASIMQDASRARSASGGTVLPRIPSLMESPRPQMRKSFSLQDGSAETGAVSSTTSPTMQHSPRPSAASIRSFNQNRRHSSIDDSLASRSVAGTSQYSRTAPSGASHAKQGSFDQNWSMSTVVAAADATPPTPAAVFSSADDSQLASPPANELGMTVVNSLDLDRGYFSGGEIDNRKARNLLRKRDSPTHARAPSDSYGTKRLSHIFRQGRAGSIDSVNDTNSQGPASQNYYGSKPGARASGSGQYKVIKSTTPVSPTVTKLDYGDSPSIDAIAVTPNLQGSEASSVDRVAPPSTSDSRSKRSSRLTGLRAISDAITNNERSRAHTQDQTPTSLRDSPINSPSNAGSSTPSLNSKSIDLEDSSLLRSTTSGFIGRPPVAPRRKTKKETSAYTRGLEKKSPKEQIIGCDYSGWMKKKSSNIMTTWKPRLFVLRGRRLSYYYSENDTEEKGLIDISFHRVLPANNDRIVGLHATVTGAASSPTSPQNAQISTAASTDAAKATESGQDAAKPRPRAETSSMFIFKLVPPRSGLSKAVNFTKPTVHYFAVDSVQQGRLWMAALMKATIDRDETKEVITTYNQKTISLAKARAMRQRPPALMGPDDDQQSVDKQSIDVDDLNEKVGLNINFDDKADHGEDDRKNSINTTNSTSATHRSSHDTPSDKFDEKAGVS